MHSTAIFKITTSSCKPANHRLAGQLYGIDTVTVAADRQHQYWHMYRYIYTHMHVEVGNTTLFGASQYVVCGMTAVSLIKNRNKIKNEREKPVSIETDR